MHCQLSMLSNPTKDSSKEIRNAQKGFVQPRTIAY